MEVVLYSRSYNQASLIKLLFKNSGCRFTADELIDYIDLTGHSSLYFPIKNLREKIEEDPSHPVALTHRRGYGYGICTQEITKGE
ncbi:winged helix-turn-helix domain-containing protein [Anoxybacillus flavithermus]|uniref:winged helix-turn-helix domain-containing protein n=1 Tax=Anoxybacillus flavithermus TaxID=33934 RepID=UPI0005A1B35D|nr:winged helix-turn-helix domain-containing protein [Anoxybacillus flavithermus]